MYKCKFDFYDLETNVEYVERREFDEFDDVIAFVDFLQNAYDLKYWYVEDV